MVFGQKIEMSTLKKHIRLKKKGAASVSLGTLENAKEMFFDYYKRAGLIKDDNKINLSDGSGVSRYNAFTTLWMTDALFVS